KKFEDKLGKKIRHIDQTVMDKFSQYSWPGNVRELQNVIERMMNFASAGELTYDLIPEEILKVGMTSSNIDALKSPEEVERKMIIKMMELKFHKTQIAKQLDISRATLYRKIQKYRL
ncbi:MAG: helix-turn-helix domain-containing protein, partial [Proteobacteria bacterium]|nr:helix-turn-helix domain-containing protein [Pseudomonadota bacterium]